MSLVSQEYLRNIAKYPETKEIAGSKYWGTMHNAASRLRKHRNEVLPPEEVRRFHQWLMYTSKHFVCDSCSDALPWLQANPITGNMRQDMERYVCRLHNFVNKKTNKLEVDCGTIFSEEECPTCKFQSLNDTVVDSVNNDIDGFNDARRKIFISLCKRDGIPVPEIRFGKCPEAPHRSCVIPADPTEQSIVYLDPDPLRSINHEYIHYKRMHQGEKPPHNEYDVDMEAQNMIPAAMHDTEAPTDRMASIYKRFPLYAKRVRLAHSEPAPEIREPSIRESRSGGGGFLGALDGVFKPIADMAGIPASTANTMHMSNTIGYVLNMITQSVTSPFGASVVSFLGSVLLFGVGAFSKSDISVEDRKLLYGITSNLFNNNIQLLGNASTRESISNASSQAGYALSRLDFDTFFKLLTQEAQTTGIATGVIPPEEYRGYSKAPGTPAPSPPTGGGILGGGVPLGGGIGGKFAPETVLRNQQQQTYERAIEGRPPLRPTGGYTPPLDTNTPYDIPELGEKQEIPELSDMNVVGGGIDSLEDSFMSRTPPRKQTTVYPFEEDYGF